MVIKLCEQPVFAPPAIALEPYRLVSLGKIMKPFRTAFFVRMCHIFGVIELARRLTPNSEAFDDEMKTNMNALLADLESACVELELTASLATVRKIRGKLTEVKGQASVFYPLIAELQGRLDDEMGEKFFWGLTIKEAEHYNTPREGWEDILERFPDITSDIEEARKCFALSRYPAAVFHTLQVVEAGLIEFGKFISVEDPKSGWTAVANKLKKIISKKHEDRTEFEKQNFEFMEQIQGTVEALK